MAKFDIHPFLRECYLRSEPSVDIDAIPDGEQIKCSDYKLKLSVYDTIKQEYEITDKELSRQIDWYMMNKGPTWVDDTKTA